VDSLSTAEPRNLWRVRQRVGMVFQNPDNQIVAGTVEEDVAFGPENAALPPAEIRRRVDDALDAVGLQAYRTHPPTRLSGGQKQLLAIAGVLATRPACIVLDEPTSMLDPPGRQRVLETVRRLNAEEGIALVLITHSMDEATAASRVLVMDQGRIVLNGSPGSVFAERDQLQAIGLDVPVAVEMTQALRARGIPLPAGQLTIDELARALC
jgi:energy-coupling factor transport system ATP-binding protein